MKTTKTAQLKVAIRRRKNKVPVSLRTFKDELRYEKTKQTRKNNSKTVLQEETSIREWDKWKLIHNEFPYSSAFKTHHMLLPKRVVSQENLTQQEKNDLEVILKELSQSYDCQLINFSKKQSIKQHFHIHLLVYKDYRTELKI